MYSARSSYYYQQIEPIITTFEARDARAHTRGPSVVTCEPHHHCLHLLQKHSVSARPLFTPPNPLFSRTVSVPNFNRIAFTNQTRSSSAMSAWLQRQRKSDLIAIADEAGLKEYVRRPCCRAGADDIPSAMEECSRMSCALPWTSTFAITPARFPTNHCYKSSTSAADHPSRKTAARLRLWPRMEKERRSRVADGRRRSRWNWNRCRFRDVQLARWRSTPDLSVPQGAMFSPTKPSRREPPERSNASPKESRYHHRPPRLPTRSIARPRLCDHKSATFGRRRALSTWPSPYAKCSALWWVWKLQPFSSRPGAYNAKQ